MTVDPEIRPVTLEDLEALIDIYRDAAIHHATIDPDRYRIPAPGDVADRLRRRIEGRGATSEYVAAILDGRIVGSATIDIEDRGHPGAMLRPIPTAEFGVSVINGHRGQGIGRALIGYLEAWAVEHGVERVILNVAEANVDAIRLYHGLGYRDYERAMRKDVGQG